MLYLNKLLQNIKQNPTLFKTPDIILILGLSSSCIKELKKFAIENGFISQQKQECILTKKGEKYLTENPVEYWCSKEFPLRPDINLEYLKEEKTPPILTKAIRNLAKYLIDNEQLKEYSLEQALFNDIKSCSKLIRKIELDIIGKKRILLEDIFNKYIQKGLTKSLIAVIFLVIITENIDKIAIYEKSQFQIKFNPLMFDRMLACPQNFELQKTEMDDEYILKDISKIILNNKSNNILEITKGLFAIIRNLDKYAMNTQNLSYKTLRLRNTIVNAKDPISLFERDIPKVISGKKLKDCDREFLNDLKLSLNELRSCTDNLIKDLKLFIFQSFKTTSKEDLCKRFLEVKEYVGDTDLKVLLNSIIDINVSDDLWVNRIATFVNKQRVPKDWSDNDYADFKVKTTELALKFFVLEATIGTDESCVTQEFFSVLNSFLNLSKQEQMVLLRKVVNF